MVISLLMTISLTIAEMNEYQLFVFRVSLVKWEAYLDLYLKIIMVIHSWRVILWEGFIKKSCSSVQVIQKGQTIDLAWMHAQDLMVKMRAIEAYWDLTIGKAAISDPIYLINSFKTIIII